MEATWYAELVWRSGLLLVAACGRSGFDEGAPPRPGDAGSDTLVVDTPPVDVILDPFDAPAGATVVTLGETPSATFGGVTLDTHIASDPNNKGKNFGGSATIKFKNTEEHGLLQFSVTAIPAGATIVGARLHLFVESVSGTADLIVSPVLESWTAGTDDGAAGVANWSDRTSAAAWTAAGASIPGSAGAVVAMAPIAFGVPVGLDLPATLVQSWLDVPSSNFGIMLTTNADVDAAVSSSESSVATVRPELVVTYFP